MLVLVSFPLTGFSDTMKKANDFYTQGEYTKSIDEYEKWVRQGYIDENLFYNLGNAYYRAKQWGPSIYNYEKALRLMPTMNDAKINLEIAQRKVQETVDFQFLGAEEEPLWVRLALRWPKAELVKYFFVFYAMLFVCLLVLVLKPYSRFRNIWLGGAALSFAVSLFVGYLWNRQVNVVENRHQAVVIAESVDVREAPSARSTDRGELYPGLHVRILDIENTWARIRLINGLEGWVPRNSLGEFAK